MKAYTVIVDRDDEIISVPLIAKNPLDLAGLITKVIDKYPDVKLSEIKLVDNGKAHERHNRRKTKIVKKMKGELPDAR